MLIIIIVLIIAVGIGVWYFKNNRTSKEEQTETVNQPNRQAEAPEPDPSVEIYDSLLSVNIFLRTNVVPVEVITLVEKMIDNLKVATPQMIERHPNHDLTYELKEICNKHLQGQLKEYFDMSLPNRDKYMTNLKERLNDIADLIERAKNIVENDEVSEMKMIAGFLETKYSRPLDS